MFKLPDIILGLGSKENIENIGNCMTKLRIKVKDINKVSRETILSSGVKDVLILEDVVHIPVGIDAETVSKDLKNFVEKH